MARTSRFHRVAAVVLRYGEHTAGTLGGLDNHLARPDSEPEGLLDRDVYAGLERFDRRDMVEPAVGDDIDGIRLLDSEQLVEVGVDAGARAEPLLGDARDVGGRGLVEVAQGDDLKRVVALPLQLDLAVHVTEPHAAAADLRDL